MGLKLSRANFKYKHTRILIYILMFVATTFLIFKMFPQRTHFDKKYEVGKPWHYELLTAPFDFPIYKTDSELRQERDSIKRRFTPYYTIDANKAIDAIDRFKADTTIKGNIRYHLQRALQNIYKRGVVTQTDYDDFKKSAMTSINVSDSSNIWRKIEVANIFTPTSALGYISSNYPITAATLDSLNISRFVEVNLNIDKNKSEHTLNELLKSIPLSNGMVQAGERIIDRGEIVKQEQGKILNSLKKEYADNTPNQDNKLVALADIFMIAILLALFVIYVVLFRPEFIRIKNAVFIVVMILIVVCGASLIMGYNSDIINVVPFALMAIIIRIFFDSRTALFIHNIVVLIVSLFVPSPFLFLMLHIPAGMIAVSTLKQLTHRGQLVQSAIFIFITYAFIYSFCTIIETGSFTFAWQHYLIFAVNALLLLFAYILIYIFEKLFGYLSDVTLVELSNINNKLLMDFSAKAPGTFQHVIQVSTLAAAIAQKINANMLLARTGALYHDIGKMKNPMCFIENQVSGFNPLNDMTCQEAARVIIAHVDDGVKIAEQNSLPKQIINFIKSHHAKSLVRYFYITEQKENPNVEIDKSLFSYNGRYPDTKEEAIVMMADAVEAASRSLKEYNETTIGALVDDIINTQVADQSFKESPLTFKHIDIAKNVLKEKLINIYHSRIEYPK
ncbi:MAG: HDIG domain-containing protein [Porphyromonadaceae bacterium]|nr:HDIG domain-containing protein [Porphyromonadaceae bacterium]